MKYFSLKKDTSGKSAASVGGSLTGITSTVKLSVTVEKPSLAKTLTTDTPFALLNGLIINVLPSTVIDSNKASFEYSKVKLISSLSASPYF